MLLACGIIQAQVSPTDSITNLDEVILLENLIQKKASGITPSSEIGIAELEQFGPADFASGLNQVSGVYLFRITKINIQTSTGADDFLTNDSLFGSIPEMTGRDAITVLSKNENLDTDSP